MSAPPICLRARHRRRIAGIALAAALAVSAAPACAQAYTDRAAFLSAAPAPAATETFDNLPAGTNLPSGSAVGAITVTHTIAGTGLRVAGQYPTTSGTNSLGTADADILQDGDDLAFTFPPRNAFGLTIITKEALQSGDITVSSGSLSATIDAAAIQGTLPDGSHVYFLGIVSPTAAFINATLATIGGGHFFYNVDDITTAAAADTDADGIADTADNCTTVPNGNLLPDAGGHSQRDTDGDGYGNRCDGDLNNNGAVNAADLALFRLAFGNTSNPNADINGNGSVNAADLALFRQLFGKPPGPSALHP